MYVAFVTCNVPQLKTDQRVLVPVEDFEGKVDADGRPVVLRKELVHVAANYRRLPRAEFSDDEDLVQVLSPGPAPHLSNEADRQNKKVLKGFGSPGSD